MNQNDIDINFLALFIAGFWGLIRIILKFDYNKNRVTQFVLLVVIAMPLGYMSYIIVSDCGFSKAAYPLSFIVGKLSLSLASKFMCDSVTEIFKKLAKKDKTNDKRK